MRKLATCRTRTIFETSATIHSRGKRRQIIICAEQYGGYVRLKGTKQRLDISWEAIYSLAAKLEASRIRAEKQAAKQQKKGGR